MTETSRTDEDTLPDAEFLTGVGGERWHAIPRDSLAYRVTGPAYSVALPACGELVRIAPKFGAYDPATVPVKFAPCPQCRWIAAAKTGTFEAALDELEHPLARNAAAMILNEAGRDLDEGEPVPEEAIDLLAAVSRHAPARLVSEECAEGDCEHGAGLVGGECPGHWACPACSLQAGSWAGEWQGKYREECTIAAPCVVLLALAEHAGVSGASDQVTVDRAALVRFLAAMDPWVGSGDEEDFARLSAAAGVE